MSRMLRQLRPGPKTVEHWRMHVMSHIKQSDHIGITVADLDAATEFFADLGLEIEGRTFVEGEFIDTVTGIPNSRSEIVMLRPPGGGTRLELGTFIRPDHQPGSPNAMATELGLQCLFRGRRPPDHR
jgi:catechol 2,3-dioxygenase-like lactoylglutathione lyase family enzyme